MNEVQNMQHVPTSYMSQVNLPVCHHKQSYSTYVVKLIVSKYVTVSIRN